SSNASTAATRARISSAPAEVIVTSERSARLDSSRADPPVAALATGCSQRDQKRTLPSETPYAGRDAASRSTIGDSVSPRADSGPPSGCAAGSAHAQIANAI